MHTLNKMKLSMPGIPSYGTKSNDFVVHSNNAAYSKLHVPIVRNIINSLYVIKTHLK